jgi:hypothetical protein
MEVGCICCGADLTALYPHPLPTVDAMCERCRREVQKLRAGGRLLQLEAGPAIVRSGRRPGSGGSHSAW